MSHPSNRFSFIPTPTSPAPGLPDFSFEETDGETTEESSSQAAVPTEVQRHHFDPAYNLPPLKALPPEILRKGKSSKQKKKDKEKADAKGGKEEWVPLGFAKWGAMIRANPIYKKVSRASKCLSTKDWSVAITELRLVRTLERVEALENVAKWSYRQPKKQRNLAGMTKIHWDYLLDEMKWMRVDFREERKWKYVLAFNISTAVLEWHEAETREERVKRGICVLWKRPRPTDSESSASQQRQHQHMEVDSEGVVCEQGDKENAFSDQESGDDDDEGETEQREIVDALETRNVLEEALEGSGSGSGESGESSVRQSMGPDSAVRPKVEDVEDSSALGNVSGVWQKDVDGMDVDSAPHAETEGTMTGAGDAGGTQSAKTEVVDLAGLKSDSSDPVLGSRPNSESQTSTLPVPSSSKSAPKSNLYAPLRERIAYSDDTKLFVDNDDLDLVKALSDLTTDDSLPPPPDVELPHTLGLSDLFPDLQPLGIPDVAPSEAKKRSDKKSERDDSRRVDDPGYTKIAPMGKFMLCKPTLLSPLQPVRRWKNGKWLPPEEAAVTDTESSSSKITDEQLSELFDGAKPQASIFVPHPPKDNKKRLDHAWTPAEDALLKSFVEKYTSNWTLVADSFNSARVTISIDKRTPWDCFERWNLKLGKLSGVSALGDVTSPTVGDGTPPPTPSTSTSAQIQMTTRGVKRLANISITQGQAGGAGATGVSISSDAIKRRRHSLMYETIRRTAKKREATQKAASMSQRKPSNIHDTHGQYNKMPKLTPAELSRMKAEKESRDHQEMLMARRRHEAELARQQLLRAQQQAPVAATATGQQPQPQQQQQPQQQPQQPQPQSQQTQPQPQVQVANGAARPGTQPSQPNPQIRAQSTVPQVNISQQQRMPTPMTAAAAVVRMSPQQMLQVQAAQAQAQARANAITAVAQTQAQVHAQLQAQAQVQAHGTPQATLSSLPAGAHLSPPYHSRAATSSPGISVTQQASPPRTVVTPSNAGVAPSPRPPSAQPQLPLSSPQIQANTMPRPASTIAAHYLPVVPPGTHFTQEQMDQALRLSSLMQRTTMSQAQQGGQYSSQS
ncbi:hypothetical protein JVU11DRAFT_248 [Chiua virens]|nr:hypothetical protein JVU11DRAFT_248 [Chiua virens]